MTTSFIVPCYQEEAALDAFGPLLSSIPAEEILFVDDGSTDGTPARLRALASADPRVRVLTHATNRGVGAAQRTGFEAARGDVVVVYDADRTYPLEDGARLVAGLTEGVDVVTATPFGAPGALAEVSWFRRLLSRGAVVGYRAVLGRRARHLSVFTCAFRAYRHAALQGLAFRSDGFPAAAEILGRLLLRGATVVEIPSVLRTRLEGRSKMRVGRVLVAHALTLLRLLWARIRRRP